MALPEPWGGKKKSLGLLRRASWPERFTHYHLVLGDRVERTVPTYRGEHQNFG
ncbi:hypothetical protein AB0M80_09315 [Amycolatopsis sp. NPDC051045]|uniref:hypothetical protein n=1 Tax=Amycolatopsis sp. NPDC051045 TaxID=3156922 RepID=UPI00341850E7